MSVLIGLHFLEDGSVIESTTWWHNQNKSKLKVSRWTKRKVCSNRMISNNKKAINKVCKTAGWIDAHVWENTMWKTWNLNVIFRNAPKWWCHVTFLGYICNELFLGTDLSEGVWFARLKLPTKERTCDRPKWSGMVCQTKTAYQGEKMWQT